MPRIATASEPRKTRMLESIKLIARTALTGRPMPYSGLDLINRILVACGRAPETTAAWNAWIEDLTSDAEMADAYERAKAIIAASWKDGETKYFVGWPERLKRSAHLVDVFYALMRALKPTKIIETGV